MSDRLGIPGGVSPEPSSNMRKLGPHVDLAAVYPFSHCEIGGGLMHSDDMVTPSFFFALLNKTFACKQTQGRKCIRHTQHLNLIEKLPQVPY